MRLTRRGWFVVALVAGAIASGALFGPRGLNAIAAPGVVALVAAVVTVARIDQPELGRELPSRGQRGETVTVELHLRADAAFSAEIADAVDEGLAATGNERPVAVGEGPIEYDLQLRERGEGHVGPLVVEARDVLGLAAERFRYPTRREILVRPQVRPLAGPRRESLTALYGGSSDDRQEFDHLRHYQRGDPVRDIHWKSSAKQPDEDLVVKEFAVDERDRSVEITGTATDGRADAMAKALASIAVDLLNAGVRVGLTTSFGRHAPAVGDDHRNTLLDHLAVTDGGPVPEGARERAEIHVEAAADGTVVTIHDRTVPFTDLAGVGAGEDAETAPVAAA